MKDAKQDRLKATKLFADLDRKEVELVSEITTELTVPAGTVLAREGSAGHEAFVIEEGTVDITIGGVKVNSAGPGELVGELALLLHDERQATVTATTELKILVIEPGRFQQLLDSVPSVSRRLVVSLAKRLRETDQAFKH